jgi:hypothetical protein
MGARAGPGWLGAIRSLQAGGDSRGGRAIALARHRLAWRLGDLARGLGGDFLLVPDTSPRDLAG